MAEAAPLPAVCRNHPSSPSTHGCMRCGGGFCSDCVVVLGGRVVCGGCKDEELRSLRSGVGVTPAAAPLYFAVGTAKFAVLSVCTLGLYQAYWSYRMWKAIKEAEGSDIWPVARGIFLGITNFRLFSHVATAGEIDQAPLGWPPSLLAALVLVISLMGRLPGPVGLLALFSFVPSLPVVALVQKLRAKNNPEAPRNAGIEGAEWILVLLGAVVVSLAVIGTLASPS